MGKCLAGVSGGVGDSFKGFGAAGQGRLLEGLPFATNAIVIAEVLRFRV